MWQKIYKRIYNNDIKGAVKKMGWNKKYMAEGPKMKTKRKGKESEKFKREKKKTKGGGEEK